MEVRSLNVNDLFAVSNMLMQLTGSARKELSVLIAPKAIDKKDSEKVDVNDVAAVLKQMNEKAVKDTETGIQLALIVGEALFIHAAEPMKEWLASLIGATAEEFGVMSIDTPFDIFRKLSEKEDIKSFFSKAFTLFSKTNKSAGQYIGK